MSLIIRDATIHSPIDPFATAIHIEDGVIIWIGDEDTAGFRANSHPGVTELDAGGRLITPAFVDPLSPTADARVLLAHGVTAVHTTDLAGSELSGGHPVPAPGVDVTPIVTADDEILGDLTGSPGGNQILATRAGTAELISRFLTSPSVLAAASTGSLLALTVTSADDALAVVEAVTDSLASLPPGAPHRIHVDASVDLPDALLALAEIRGIPLVITNLAGAGGGDGIQIRLAELAQRGIPFALASGGGNPWLSLTTAATTGPAPLTARAAFNAHVRGAWRVTPGHHMGRGVLRVGNPADVAVWDVESLIVQTPDASIAAWSTDQRSGTPLLPVLGAGETLPKLWRAFRAGNPAVLPRP